MGLSQKKINLLRAFVNFTCEECRKTELQLSQESILKGQGEIIKLQPHRIRRGCQGGTYELRNLKMVCPPCHRRFHSGEQFR